MASKRYYMEIISLINSDDFPPGGVCGIYKIENARNKKTYIGSSVDIRKRIIDHARSLDYGAHHSITLQRAYDQENLSFYAEVLETCDKDSLLDREQYYIDNYQSYDNKKGYNIARFAGSPTRGTKLSEDTKKRMSTAHKERAKDPLVQMIKSQVMIQRWKDPKYRERQLQKMHENRVYSPMSQEQKDKISATKRSSNRPNHWLGRTHTEESKAKMRESARNRRGLT